MYPRIREVIPDPDSVGKKLCLLVFGLAKFVFEIPNSVGFCNVYFGDKGICRNSGFTFQTFMKQYEPVTLPPSLEGFPFQMYNNTSHATFFEGIIPCYKHSCTFLHIY